MELHVGFSRERPLQGPFRAVFWGVQTETLNPRPKALKLPNPKAPNFKSQTLWWYLQQVVYPQEEGHIFFATPRTTLNPQPQAYLELVGNKGMLYGDYEGILLPYSLLTTSKYALNPLSPKPCPKLYTFQP